jgi:hypothetical protein
MCSTIPLQTYTKNKKPNGVNQSKNMRALPLGVTCAVCPNFSCTPNFTAITGPSGATGITGVVCIGTGCSSCTGAIATLCCINIPNNVVINAFLTANDQNVLGNLNVGLNSDIKGQLTVETNAQFASNACMEANLGVGQNALFERSAVVLGDLTVDTATTVDEFLIVNNNETVNGPLMINGPVGIDGNLIENCNATISGLVTASGPLIVYNGQTINDGGLSVLYTGPTGASGHTGPVTVNINGDVDMLGTETVSNSVFVTADLTSDQNTTLNNVTTNGTLTTNGAVIANDGITIASGDHILNAGSLAINAGILTVNGSTNFESLFTANQGAVMENITVNGGQNIPIGNLTITSGSANFAGTLTTQGTIIGAGASTLDELTLTDTIDSVSPTTGTLVVMGGVGIAQDLWLGQNQYFADVSPLGIPAPLNYYEETIFSTGFIFGGQTVNPSTSVAIRIVRVGDIVNLIIPEIIYPNPGAHIDVISSTIPLPAQFRPTSTVRGASSTIISNNPGSTPAVVGALGEFNVDPSGIITLGLAGDSTASLGLPIGIAPQRIASTDYVEADINTITYSVASCSTQCRTPLVTP